MGTITLYRLLRIHRLSHTDLYCFVVLVTYLTLYDPMDYSLPVTSIHGISQARIPEWVPISYSRDRFVYHGFIYRLERLKYLPQSINNHDINILMKITEVQWPHNI